MTDTRIDDGHVDDLLPLYGLDALDDVQTRRVRRHLATCEICAAEAALWAEDAANLHTDTEPVPDELRRRIMDAVDRELSAADRRPRHWGRWIAAACMAIVVAAGGVVWWRVAQPDTATQETSVVAIDDVLTAPDMQKSAGTVGTGTVAAMYAPSQRATVVTVKGLPTTEKAMGYQVWVEVDGKLKSAGMVHADQQSSVIMTDMSRPAGVSLSVEPMTGSPRPTSPLLVQVPMP